MQAFRQLRGNRWREVGYKLEIVFEPSRVLFVARIVLGSKRWAQVKMNGVKCAATASTWGEAVRRARKKKLLKWLRHAVACV